MTLTRRQVADLIARHGLRPAKALGQHFVADPNTVRRIARLADVGPEDHVVEIGAGLGSLTLALAETGAAVTAVELDRRLVPVLEEVVGGRGVRIVAGDALRLDWDELLADAAAWALVANLPYNIATPLVLMVLERVPRIVRMLVMVQREVAERLAAPPRTRAYGAVTVKVAYWATAEIVGRVPPAVFVPRPNVESALVRIVRRERPPTGADPDRLFALVQAGFAQRRKMLRRSLAGLVEEADFAAAGIPPTARAEDLSVEEWGRLAAA